MRWTFSIPTIEHWPVRVGSLATRDICTGWSAWTNPAIVPSAGRSRCDEHPLHGRGMGNCRYTGPPIKIPLPRPGDGTFHGTGPVGGRTRRTGQTALAAWSLAPSHWH